MWLWLLHYFSLHFTAAVNFSQSQINPLTPSTVAVPNCCCSKGSAPVLSARAPECQKLKMVGYTSMALDRSNSSNLEQLALKGLSKLSFLAGTWLIFASPVQNTADSLQCFSCHIFHTVKSYHVMEAGQTTSA